MQILMARDAYERVRERLAALGEGLDVVTLEAGGVARRDGAEIDAAGLDPEVFWFSLDLFRAGLLPAFFQCVQAGRRGRWAQVFLAGLDHPAFAALLTGGLRITRSSAQAAPIAEYVLSHALSLLHPIGAQARAQAAHDWRRVEFREIAATRWLLVGFGSIGSEIARRLKPFGAHLTVIRRNLAAEALADEVAPMSELARCLPQADVVVLACALNAQTRGLAGEAFFSALKPGAVLINIARGALIDEAALQAGLGRDQPAAAVLDVFDAEPLPADAWFWDHPKVRVTAHTSNAGDGVAARGDDLFLENLRRYLGGEALLNEASVEEVSG